MSVLTIPDRFIDEIVSRPETGMGFQVLYGTFTYQRGATYEGPMLILDSFFVVPLREIDPGIVSFGDLQQVAAQGEMPSNEIEIDDLNVNSAFEPRVLAAITSAPLSKSPSSSGTMTVQQSTTTPGNPALPVTKMTRPYQAFLRFGSRPTDPRVLPNGGLAPRTFATTMNDGVLAPSGAAAVGRYALPHPLPAKFLYTLVPPVSTSIQFGAALPSFGQSGGGVEVYFPQGWQASAPTPHELPEA